MKAKRLGRVDAGVLMLAPVTGTIAAAVSDPVQVAFRNVVSHNDVVYLCYGNTTG